VNTCEDGSLDYGEVVVEGDLTEVVEGIVVKVPGGSLWKPFLSEKAER